MPKLLRQTDAGGAKIVNLATPTVGSDAATKDYVDSAGNVFVQNAAPSSPPSAYLWVQTGLGDGTDFTFWVEDGT